MNQNIFMLSWKKAGIIIAAFIAAVILHNAVSALFHTEDAIFFIIAIFIIPLYAIIAIIYTIIKKIKK